MFTAVEAIVENGQIRLLEEISLPEEARASQNTALNPS